MLTGDPTFKDCCARDLVLNFNAGLAGLEATTPVGVNFPAVGVNFPGVEVTLYFEAVCEVNGIATEPGPPNVSPSMLDGSDRLGMDDGVFEAPEGKCCCC